VSIEQVPEICDASIEEVYQSNWPADVATAHSATLRAGQTRNHSFGRTSDLQSVYRSSATLQHFSGLQGSHHEEMPATEAPQLFTPEFSCKIVDVSCKGAR